MSKVKNWRTLSFVLWVAITIIMVVTMPNLDKLVREKGEITLPEASQSVIADKMLQDMNKEGGDTYGIIAVFTSGNEEALSAKQHEKIASTLHELSAKQKELGITELTTHLDSKDIEKQLLSEDKTTALTQIYVAKEHGEITDIADELNAVLKNTEVDTYLTGSHLVANDFMNSSQDGVKKTEIIAIIFILIVLILVFRSPIVPVVSLLTVGVSYLVSLGIITQLVDNFNFPFSNFTQVFVVVVLFGVGTDYNILLYTRFKEELAKGESSLVATKTTFKTAGKTVLYSGLAVLIGFCSLILANFKLYQSTSAVAIGVAVLLLVLITLNPFFMVLLGKKMFYPIKQFKGHGNSRTWGFLSKSAVTRPILSILLVLAVTIPFILHYSKEMNFNDLWEVNDKYESKQGINIIDAHFPSGFSSPATLVIQTNQPMDNAESLKVLDELTEKIANIDGVANVLSPTRPVGNKIEALYIADQTTTLENGLSEANDGVGKIHDGLSTAEKQLQNSETNGFSDVQRLINGTKTAKSGVSALTEALNVVTKGFESGAEGSKKLEQGLGSLEENLTTLSDATNQLTSGYGQLENGLRSYDQYFALIADAIQGAKQGYLQIEGLMNQLIASKPELATDNNVKTTLTIATGAATQLDELTTQLETLRKQHQVAMTSFQKANDSLTKVNDGLAKMENGVTVLKNGANELSSGLHKGADGSKTIASKTGDLQTGLTQINEGQQKLFDGLQELEGKMGDLQAGLGESTDGLSKISDGLSDAQSYLADLSQSQSAATFYIPEEALNGEEFQKALDTYMSSDRKTAKITVILDVNPYSKEAMPIINEVSEQVKASLHGTSLDKAEHAIGGRTSKNADLQVISQEDFLRTATIMLIGIAIVLMVITRSVSKALFIVGSLILVYFASLGISEFISTAFFGADLLSWNVPFFSFIMIVALGVDYSIFLMVRYNEEEGDVTDRIVQASKHIGGVVLSAALILGGTFAALIPSGVLTLVQVATVVMVALVLLSFVAMPILLPALMKVKDQISKWGQKDK